MQSFFRTILVLFLVSGAFVGGWFSSDIIKQDPFLSNILKVETDQYDRFVRDLSTAIQEMRLLDQNELNGSFINNNEVPSFAQLRELERELGEEELSLEVNSIDSTHINNQIAMGNAMVFEPNKMVSTVVQQMSSKEKLTFLLWARSRFSDEQLKKIEGLMQDGITAENFLTLYQYTRKSLKGNDYEYLLSFVDRYLISQQPDPEDAIPVFQAKESSINVKPKKN